MTSRLRRFAANESAIAKLLSLISFVLYLTTMCRTVSFIDSGELATVASVLGIAHPTGYPLFTLMTHCFLLIPLGGQEIVRLNVFSSAIVAAAVGVFFRVVLIMDGVGDPRKLSAREEPGTKPMLLLAAGIASLALAFSTTVWSQSVSIEVYGLHLLLILLTLFVFFKGIRADLRGSQTIPRELFAASFLLGLSFANHLTTLLIIPALGYIYLKSYGINRASAVKLSKLLPFFALGLSPYLYLPIRARVHPPLDWGYPAELERLVWHVSGKQYRNWMFSSFDSAEKQLSYFFSHFPSEYNWLLIAIMAIGIWRLYQSGRRLFWFLLLAFIGCLFYSINYEIHDIDSYFLLAYIVAGFVAFFGIVAVLEYTQEFPSRWVFFASAVLLLLLPIGQLTNNRQEVSESDNYLVDDYTHNVFQNAESNAVIITYQWDYFVSPSLYYQTVLKERPDLTIIDKELLRRSWYFIHLRNRYPQLIGRSQMQVDAFLRELYKFEHDEPYDPRMIESCYVAMINSFIDNSLDNHSVYLGPEIEPEFGQKYARIPSGLLFRLARTGDSAVFVPGPLKYRSASIESRLTIGMRGLYAKMLTSTSALLLSKNLLSDASNYVEKAISIDSTYQPAIMIRKEIAHRSSLRNP
jgi:hypothetical protein